MSLADLAACDDTLLCDFFKKLGDSLGGGACTAQCVAIGKVLATQHVIFSTRCIRQRTPSLPQMQEVLKQAQAPPAFIGALELWLKIKFKPLPVSELSGAHAAESPSTALPSSAPGADAAVAKVVQPRGNGYRAAKYLKPDEMTCGDMLISLGRKQEMVIPPALYYDIPPGKITSADVTKLMQRLLVWCIIMFGTVDIDLSFKDFVIPQIEKRWPDVPNHGSKTRTWYTVVTHKFNNARKDIRKVRNTRPLPCHASIHTRLASHCL